MNSTISNIFLMKQVWCLSAEQQTTNTMFVNDEEGVLTKYRFVGHLVYTIVQNVYWARYFALGNSPAEYCSNVHRCLLAMPLGAGILCTFSFSLC